MGDKTSLAETIRIEETLDEVIPKGENKHAVRYDPKFCKQYNADTDNMSRKQLVEYAKILENKCNKTNRILAREEDMIIASSRIKHRQGVSKLSEREEVYLEKNHRHAYKVLFGLVGRFDSWQDFKRALMDEGAFRMALHVRAEMIDKIGKEWGQYEIPEKLQKLDKFSKMLHSLTVLEINQSGNEVRERVDKVAEVDSHAKYTDIDTVEKLGRIKTTVNEVCVPSFDFDASDLDLSDNMPEWVKNINKKKKKNE